MPLQVMRLYASTSYEALCHYKLQGLYAITSYEALMPSQVTRASCHTFQGPRATMFQRLYSHYVYVAGLGLRPYEMRTGTD